MNPTLEVIICTYNGSRYLEQQLDSILNQSVTIDKISVYDDNSSDETANVLKKFKNKHKNFSVYQNPVTLGYNRNFEKALQAATCDLIALSDQDDYWHKDKLKNQIKAISTFDCSLPFIIHHDLRLINEKNSIIHPSFMTFRNYSYLKDINPINIVYQNGVMGNTILLNKKLLEYALPFPKVLDNHDRWLAMVNELFGQRLYLDKVLIDYRIHNRNTSNAKILSLKGRLLNQLNIIFRKSVLSRKQKAMLYTLIRREKLPKNTIQKLRSLI